MGQQLAREMNAPQSTPPAVPPPPPSAPAVSGLLESLSPAEAARELGVSESDVMTALTDGSLKGKKIGSSWRIMRAALEEFLKS